MILPSLLISSLLFFMAKDIYYDGTKPEQVLMYKNIILLMLCILSFLEALLFLIGSFVLIYLKKKDFLLGFLLGAVIILLYLIEMFSVYLHYWD